MIPFLLSVLEYKLTHLARSSQNLTVNFVGFKISL